MLPSMNCKTLGFTSWSMENYMNNRLLWHCLRRHSCCQAILHKLLAPWSHHGCPSVSLNRFHKLFIDANLIRQLRRLIYDAVSFIYRLWTWQPRPELSYLFIYEGQMSSQVYCLKHVVQIRPLWSPSQLPGNQVSSRVNYKSVNRLH